MKVAGFGLRKAATAASLGAALDLAGGRQGISAFATVADKADSKAILDLAATLGVPVRAIAPRDLVAGVTLSPNQPLRYGSGSVAEGSALAAAGPGARLIVSRIVSPDRHATVAIAEGDGMTVAEADRFAAKRNAATTGLPKTPGRTGNPGDCA